MGLNPSPICELSFDDCWVSEDRLLGEEGGGWEQAIKTLDGGRTSVAALSIGLAESVYGRAKSYTQEREQFDRPVSEFNAVRDRLVLMHRKAKHAQPLTHKAVTRYDVGRRVGRESALAKLDASEAAHRVVEDMMQVLDGYGYATDFAPQRFYRGAKLMEIGEGANEIQHLIIGCELGL